MSYKDLSLPQYKIDHLLDEQGDFFFVIMVLVYNPAAWVNWTYSFHREGSYPSNERSHATLYKTLEAAEAGLQKIVDTIERMHYSTH